MLDNIPAEILKVIIEVRLNLLKMVHSGLNKASFYEAKTY
jgi:hypothetical protein